jgi:predicted nucleotidyltransferase
MTDEMNRLVDKAASALEAAGAKEVHVFGSGSMDPPNNDLIGDIVRRIVETAQPEKIILFGSRARGDARPNSDFDVLVIKKSSEPSYRRDAPLYVALADLPVEVEVLVYTPEEVAEWAQVPQAFVTTATREGKTVYERKS